MFSPSQNDIIQEKAVARGTELCLKIAKLLRKARKQKGEDLNKTKSEIKQLRDEAIITVNLNCGSSNGFHMIIPGGEKDYKYAVPLKALLKSLESKKGVSVIESTRNLLTTQIQLKFSINNFLRNRAIEGQDAIDYLKTFPYCEESQAKDAESYTGYKIITFSDTHLNSIIKDLANKPDLNKEQKNDRGSVRSFKGGNFRS